MIFNKPDKAAEIFHIETGYDKEITKELVKSIRFDSAIYHKDLKTFEGSIKFLIEVGVIDKEYNIKDLIDDSYLRKAVEKNGSKYLTEEEYKGEHWIEDKIY
ncbi:hypothetical protein QT235_04405 [Geobacillus stearothermophilus]|nr:hypothetical protein QT235_04405 [Geobacillus stearothermophilus]